MSTPASPLGMLATALIVIAALANLVPVVGVLSADRLQSLYGVSLQDPNLVILLRHRAVLFGIVGASLLAAAFHTPLRAFAYPAGFVSMLSFLVVVYLVGDANAELRRVAWVDVVASVGLLIALAIDLAAKRT